MSKRETKLYIEDLISSMEKIEKYVAEMSLDNFLKDTKTIDAVTRNLSIIGYWRGGQ
jgi:uncharacterized protein with HEPN domain